MDLQIYEDEYKNMLPSYWKNAKLGEVAEYLNGRAFKPKEWKEKGLPIIRIQNLNNEDAKYNYSDEIFEEKYLVKQGELLFAWSASLGAYIWKGKDAWLNQHIFKVVPKSFIHKLYLYYYLDKVTKELYGKAHGSGMVHVTKKKFEATSIVLPPLPEQRAIVSKIEQLFSELDNGIANLTLAQEQLKVYRQAVLKKAFEGELTRQWREQQTDLPDARELLEQIRVEREEGYSRKLDEWKRAVEVWEDGGKVGRKPKKPRKLKDSKSLSIEDLTKLPQLPQKWSWASHSQISIINPPKPDGEESLEVSFLPMPAVEEQTGKYSLSETRKLGKVRKGYTGFIEGDVIFAKITPCMENGKVAYIEKLVNGVGFGSTEFHVSRPASNISGKYLFHYLVQHIFRKEAQRNMTGTAGQLRVPTNYFAEQPFPLCSLPEQQAIVTEIETRLSVCDKVEQDIAENLEKTEALRQSILKQAFEGMLLNGRELEEVRGAPDWEPAEVLLERIRAEKTDSSRKRKA
ncbi:MAG: restriction endonuclease subunit S [Euryarchaeota archaeon]|nr:restriction endonuclease subunit S [Euryarchaeota archaeon]